MKILVVNSGSSSIKYQLFNMPDEQVICSGMVERIGLNDSKVHFHSNQHDINDTVPINNHEDGLEKIVSLLLHKQTGVISSTSEIDAVGHRVVHGGSTFSNTTIITNEVKDKIRSLFSLAPLHNPPNYIGIDVAEKIFPSAKQIAVFDTAFHQSIPPVAHTYAIPKKMLTDHKIRVYGFHGTSHKFVSEKALNLLQNSASKIISIHLGNGCSMTAIKDGKSIDHTLGFGPVNGLIMGTRSGDIDQAIIFYLVKSLGYSVDEVSSMLHKESGMLGLTGYSDLRDIEAAASNGDKDCQLALDMNAYRIKKYIGAYTAIMNGLDAIIFTAGIGENSSYIRSSVCKDLNFLGIELDENKNIEKRKDIREIQSAESKVKILVIPTNEEVEIAKQSYDLIK